MSRPTLSKLMGAVQVLLCFVLLSVSPVHAAGSAARSANEVLKHHVEALKRGDVEQVMADYASDAVVVVAPGMLAPSMYPAKGPAVFIGSKIRALFEFFTDSEHRAATSTLETTLDAMGDGVFLQHWTVFKGTPKEATGEDVFIVRHGQIRFQDVRGD